MWYLAVFICVFTVVQFLVAASNLVFKPKLHNKPLYGNPLISVLIPARNEEKNIGIILDDLVNQPYVNIEIIVFDDQSDDHTGEIVLKMAEADSRIKLVNSPGLPDGWLGKNFACYSLSAHAKGDYFLFLDADLRIRNNIIRSVVAYAAGFRLGLLSIFPKQVVNTPGEKITVPIMNYILLSLLPLPLVQWSKFHSLAAANGQFMLFNSQIYKCLSPHKLLKNSKVEDIGIARYFKQNQIPMACLTGDESVRCRMYSGFREAVMGFSKNITAFFGDSFFIALIFWLITTFGFIPVLIVFPFNFFVLYIVMILMIRLFVSMASHQRIWDNFLYLIPQQMAMGLMLFRALMNKYFYHFQWKGRNIG